MPHLMEGLDIRLYHRYGLDIFCLVPTSRGASLVFAMTTLGCKYWYVCSFCQLRTPSSKFLLRYFEFVSIFLGTLPEDLITIISFLRYLVFDLGETVLEKL